ncbi:MAG: SpoIID/LytB domain-containing protein [Clostridia bacterium]|nr:SpoIID/LytB domain-containing protein [Clostridia bacterium]
MLFKYKKVLVLLIAVLIITIVAAPAHEAVAYVSSSENIRIGLYYKSGSKDTTLETVMISSIGGIEIGAKQNNGYTKIIETPYIVNAYVDSGVSGYHIRIGQATADVTKLFENLNTYKSMGLEVFPVCTNTNLWQLWEGCYLSQADAESAITSKIIPKAGAGDYSVALPSTYRIIIKYSNGLAAIASESQQSFLMIKSTFNGEPKTVNINGDRYRNSIELRKYSDSQITVINELKIGDYLNGVVPLEIGTTETPFEALKAQAVAARTYAIANHKHEDQGFDLCNSTCCQVYGGYDVENLATNNAVKATEGMVATFGGALANLYYFSSSGGATANSENVWSQTVPYLRSVPDPYDSTKYWSYTFTAAEMTNHLMNLGRDVGTVNKIEVTVVSESGRVLELRIYGPNGSTVFTKVSTRSAFPTYLPSQIFSIGAGTHYTVKEGDNSLNSIELSGSVVRTGNGTATVTGATNVFVKGADGKIVSIQINASAQGDFVITGAGSGHGVGMSQFGAMGMARAGYNYIDILKHYFTGIEIEKANLY